MPGSGLGDGDLEIVKQLFLQVHQHLSFLSHKGFPHLKPSPLPCPSTWPSPTQTAHLSSTVTY